MKIINATPHDITLRVNEKDTVYPKSEFVARVSSTETLTTENGIPFSKVTYGEVEGLPQEEEGVLYIVSAMVLASSNRGDLIAPNTGKTAIRNEKGHIVAVTSFVM